METISFCIALPHPNYPFSFLFLINKNLNVPTIQQLTLDIIGLNVEH
jgi:hypothetical protein